MLCFSPPSFVSCSGREPVAAPGEWLSDEFLVAYFSGLGGDKTC